MEKRDGGKDAPLVDSQSMEGDRMRMRHAPVFLSRIQFVRDWSVASSQNEANRILDCLLAMTDYKPIKEDDPTVFAKPKGAIDIPEARNLSWEDTFYDKETDIVAVFDMDEEAHKRLTKRRHTIMMYCFAFYALSLGVFLYGPNAGGFFFSAYMFCFVAWLGFKMHVLRKAQESAMEEKPEAFGVHVAVTRTGIRKDVYNIPFGGIFKTTTVVSNQFQSALHISLISTDAL